MQAINESCQSSTGDFSYRRNYSVKEVSWDDVSRGTVGNSLSCWGSNITDTRLKAKDGRSLFTVRSENWNERLGKVSTDDVAIVADDKGGGGGLDSLRPFTLSDLLSRPGDFGGYANLNVDNLTKEDLDKTVSIRFQTTFLPVGEEKRSTIEFSPEAYNYNTRSDSDPRNLILLCTTQGCAVQQDGMGNKKLFHHAKNSNGSVSNYWLEAERSDHKVGGPQEETKAERDDAVARGKATSSVIGIESMGQRFNVLMTIQIPLQQKHLNLDRSMNIMCSGFGDISGGFCDGIDELSIKSDLLASQAYTFSKSLSAAPKKRGIAFGGLKMKKKGKSNAARVSRGSEATSFSGLTVSDPRRNDNECITVTVVIYNVCSGGAPSEEDVHAAIDDLEDLYRSVENGKLGDSKFDFMKKPLTVQDTIDIKTKVTTQPPPKPAAPTFFDRFPIFSKKN